MATGQRWERLANGQIWRRFERSTGETVQVHAPFSFYDDFVSGTSAAAPDVFWTERNTGTGAGSSSQSNEGHSHGSHLMSIPNGNAVDNVSAIEGRPVVDVGGAGASNEVQMEVRLKVDFTTLSSFAGRQVFVGLLDAIPTLTGNSTYTSYLAGAGFILGENETGAATSDVKTINVTADDTATRFDADTGLTFSDDVDVILRVDLSDLTEVKYYVDGVRVNAGNSSDMTTLVDKTEAVMLPYVGMLKHTNQGDGVATSLLVDYVRIWGIR